MRDELGKTVPVLRDFWVETALAPVTPGKPTEPNGQALLSQGEIAMVSKEVGSSTQYYERNQDRLFASRNSVTKETDDPLAHWRGIRFSDLLLLNHGLAVPVGGNLDSPCQSTFEELQGSNRKTEIPQNAEKSKPVIMMNAYPHGCVPVYAPVTPDNYKGLHGNATLRKTLFSADSHPNEQNGENSKVSAPTDDLLGVDGTKSATDSTPIERYDPYEDDSPGLDLNKTSQQKPRRKKHRPKVISEAKPKQRTPKSADANETPRSMRKCVRKNEANTPSTTPSEQEAVTLDCKIPRRAVRSCRKALNFDFDFDFDLEDQFMEATMQESNAVTEYEKGKKTKNLTAISKDIFAFSPYYSARSNSEHRNGLKRASSSSTDYLCLRNAIFFPKIHKKRRTEKVLKPNTSHILSFANALESSRSALESSRATSAQNYPRKDHGIYFPEFCQKRRTKRVLKVNTSHILSFTQALASIREVTNQQNYQDNTQFIKWGDINQLNKRFIAPIYVDSEDGFRRYQKLSRSSTRGRFKDTWKKNMVKSRKRKSSATVNKLSLALYDDRHFTRNPKGRFLALPWINNNTTSVDAIIEGMKQLSLSREGRVVQYREKNTLVPYHVRNNKTNALVLYRRNGSIIPFKRAQSSKRHERAKVDLDDETNRVWNLLLEDINNQGIDGTDEEKTKWWEEERNVFRGRVDSFIARMRLVQGDRRFSPWKGSVVDSVVGVFLTQNVSDHLSSSAYMSLAARYPLKLENEDRRDSEEENGSSVKEPEICIVELDDNSDNLALNEKTVEGYICDMNSGSPNDTNFSEEKVGNSIESELYRLSSVKELDITSVNNRAIDDVMSSQNSVSSLNSVESLGLPSSNSSDVEDVINSSLLLQLAETPIDQVPSCQSDVLDLEIIKDFKPSEKKCRTENDSITNGSNKCSAIDQLHPVEEYQILSVDEESRSLSSTGSVENLTTESAIEFHLQKKASTSNMGPSSPGNHVCSFYVLEGKDMVFQSPNQQQDTLNPLTRGAISPQMNEELPTVSREDVAAESACASIRTLPNNLTPTLPLSDYKGEAHKISKQEASKRKKRKNPKKASYDWDNLRKEAHENGGRDRQRRANTMDSLDWEAIRCADVSEISDTIRDRGMNNMLAERIKEFLDRLIKDHGSINLEWLRDVPPDKAKEYLLSIRGLGLKSVECVRLLTLHHLAFPVDTNVGRIAVRLGWVPLQPLPESLQLHLLELYPVLESIQKYLWPRLCKLDQRTLYELHYHMITFGKVFCTKRQPNCNACPLRGECRHFASAFASARLALPGPQERSIILSDQNNMAHGDPQVSLNYFPMPLLTAGQTLEKKSDVRNCEPIVEIPASPEQEPDHQIQPLECDIEDAFSEDPNEIPTIKLNMEEFTQTLHAYMQSNNEHQTGDMSKALVALVAEAASIPTPKLKNVNRLRTEHHVFELPDTHHLLRGLDKREPDDPCPYLLAIWSPGETASSTEPPEKRCNFEEADQLCTEETCSYCNSQREANSQIVRGTLLIPCRTAMKGRFPLNGTYFQVNEVFADQDSSLNPIQVSRESLWNLPRRTVYFGTSIPTIFRGLSTEGIQHCFWRGYVCVRGFDQKTRAPRPLMARLHFPASKSKARGRSSEKD